MGRIFVIIIYAICLPALSYPAMATGASLTAAPPIAPHKALYEITLVSKKSGSQLADINGRMVFEWDTGCDAWTTSRSLHMTYDYTDGAPMRVDGNFSTYEPFDGKSFSFDTRRNTGDAPPQKFSGSAALGADAAGRATYIVPAGLSFMLPKGTLFPTLQTVATLREAEADHKFFNATVFDGTDDEGPVEINSFIGKRISGLDAATPGPHIDKMLLDVPAWRVHMAFFPVLKPDPQPDYEMDAVIQRNGVVSDMRIEYRDFTVAEKLVALEPAKSAVCGRR